ncbi:MAG TPA: PQQ-binding-like beta-propeller repeat protein [Rubrobacteraceae bacterium]|nr:PQQ-binding-like beta-propeller repeat protein [Rubrobacteraceae bacterium]
MRRTVLLLASMAMALLLGSGVALAALRDVPEEGTVQANGRVSDILAAGDKIYLGGSFTQLTDKDGTTIARNNLAAIDAVTGEVIDWNPNVTNPNGDSSVRTMALSSDGSRLFVGGKFTRVGGLARKNLAVVDPTTGAANEQWSASVNRPVLALAISGSRLYLGGDFTMVDAQTRERLAAVDAATGALDPNWSPRAHRPDGNNSSVLALEVSADGMRLYAGGRFNHISGIRTEKLAALDAATGAVDPIFAPGTQNRIIAMDVSDGRVFVGTGDPLEGIEAFDAETGQRYWSIAGGHPDPGAGDVQAITVEGGTVYAGGHFAQMGGLVRKRLVELDAATGQIGSWAPAVAGGNLGVWALETDAARGRLYAGGDFTKIGGIAYQKLAQFSEVEVSEVQNCTITGTPNKDVLEGTPGDDVICGGSGPDTIQGMGGNDILRGERGGDHLHGGEGDDTLDGSIGSDTADFSESPAAISASLADGIATGEGSDTLVNVENVEGSAMGDTLSGSGGSNTLRGAIGADTLHGLASADKLYGGGGSDLLRGGTGNDTVVGSGGADDLLGEEDDDTIGSKDNVSGNDSLDGGTDVNGDNCTTDATEKSIVNCEL